MDDSIFESGGGIDSANIYKCANCCSTLLNDGSENEGIAKLQIKDNISDGFSEIQIWYALEFIYGVTWTSIKNKLELEKRNPQEEITFCDSCASLLTENYNSHQNFENSCDSSSLVKEFMQKRSGLTIESQNAIDSSHQQEEMDRDEKISSFDDFVFHESDDAIESQVDSVESKYDPMSPFSDNTIKLHTTSTIDSKKLNASSRRESLRSHQPHIKIEKMSNEMIFQLTNENGNKSKRSSSRKTGPVMEYVGKSTVGSQKSVSKRKNKSVRKMTEVIPQQSGTKKTNNSWGLENKVKEDIEQNTKKPKKNKSLSKQWVCDVCGKSYTQSHSLRSHRRVKHGGEIYSCDVCGKAMKSKELLKHHRIRKHGSEEEKNQWKIACKKCGVMVFTFYLRIHISRSCAGTPRPKEKYTCDQCGKEYYSAQGFDFHLLTHSEEPKQCDVCSKVFLSSRQLFAHKYSIHAEKKFACQKCPATFVSEGHLSRHQYTHAESRKFVCEICGVTYKYPQHLRTHLKLHREIQEKGEGAFTCDICNDGKRYAHSKSLRNHTLLKHGTKVYQCSYCGKKLSCGTNLRQHEALHKELPEFNPRANMKRRSPNVSMELPQGL